MYLSTSVWKGKEQTDKNPLLGKYRNTNLSLSGVKNISTAFGLTRKDLLIVRLVESLSKEGAVIIHE